MTTAEDRTPQEWRDDLLDAMLAHVPFDGWTTRGLGHAAADLGLDAGFARLVFPGGPFEALGHFLRRADERMVEALEAQGIGEMRIRDRIATAVMTRLEQALPHREAVRRAIGLFALPRHIGFAACSTWRTVDAMWRAAGDTATDWNHYSKRAILAGVYGSTLLVWLDDRSEGLEATRAFLARRIEGVMTFEKAKAGWRKTCGNLPSPARFLGRLRYPDRNNLRGPAA